MSTDLDLIAQHRALVYSGIDFASERARLARSSVDYEQTARALRDTAKLEPSSAAGRALAMVTPRIASKPVAESPMRAAIVELYRTVRNGGPKAKIALRMLRAALDIDAPRQRTTRTTTKHPNAPTTESTNMSTLSERIAELEGKLAQSQRTPAQKNIEDRILARMDSRFAPSATKASMVGAALVLSYMTPEAAARRCQELRMQGAESRPATLESVTAHAARFERQ